MKNGKFFKQNFLTDFFFQIKYPGNGLRIYFLAVNSFNIFYK